MPSPDGYSCHLPRLGIPCIPSLQDDMEYRNAFRDAPGYSPCRGYDRAFRPFSISLFLMGGLSSARVLPVIALWRLLPYEISRHSSGAILDQGDYLIQPFASMGFHYIFGRVAVGCFRNRIVTRRSSEAAHSICHFHQRIEFPGFERLIKEDFVFGDLLVEFDEFLTEFFLVHFFAPLLILILFYIKSLDLSRGKRAIFEKL
jgi:hypothetical protein